MRLSCVEPAKVPRRNQRLRPPRPRAGPLRGPRRPAATRPPPHPDPRRTQGALLLPQTLAPLPAPADPSAPVLTRLPATDTAPRGGSTSLRPPPPHSPYADTEACPLGLFPRLPAAGTDRGPPHPRARTPQPTPADTAPSPQPLPHRPRPSLTRLPALAQPNLPSATPDSHPINARLPRAVTNQRRARTGNRVGPHPRPTAGSSRSLFYLAVLPTSALAHLARSQAERRGLWEPHPWRLRLGPPSPPPPAASSLRLSCSPVGTRSLSRSSLHSGPHFGSSFAPSSGPQTSWLHPPSPFLPCASSRSGIE
ncbi:formin-2-like [Canis lupus dingo]|uniref:formin-2-like n=1 Tax=Canis lupus dingo TaxID=286419 RepID=UPI0020C551DA|nr:formin-2-like [Canis lupus dingo]